MKKRLLKALLAASMVVGMAGCGSKESSSTDETADYATEGTFTYNSYVGTSSVQTLSNAEWEYNSEYAIMTLTQRGLYAIIYSDNDQGYEIIPEMASDMAKDVTEEYAGQYNIPEGETEGYAWEFPLREDACWEDGTPITANDYIESMKDLLDIDMQCYRASTYSYGTYAIANAYDYYYEGADLTFDDLGIFAKDDYTLVYILENPQSSEYMLYSGFTAGWLLNQDLYEGNKVETGGVVKSTYGTSVDTYMSYGPYKLTDWQDGKIITLEKNENWYGYSDEAFEGQYQTDVINYQIVDDHSTALLLFQQGNLDEVTLAAADMEQYGTSDYVMYTPESYTYKLSFNTEFDTLKSRETSGVNKTIITYKDFRKAFSLALDRADFVQSIVPTCEVEFGLYNDCYVYDPDEGLVYRDEAVAQQALCNVYDADSVSELTGYNVEEASELLESAYQQCLADGNISETDKVVLQFNTSNASETITNAVNFFNDAINAAAVGTSLEGRITVEVKEVDDAYYAMSVGAADIAYSAWGGDDFDPYDLLQCYCDEELYNDGEHGFDNTQEFTAEIDGEEYTMSFYDWYSELNAGMWVTADTSTKLQVLAAVEEHLLEEYNTLPIYALTEATLSSQKIDYITYEYNPMCESYGGLRFMKYFYNDEDWAAYCKENGNQLTY